MLKIVLLVSFIVFVAGCVPEQSIEVTDGEISIAYLRSLCRDRSVAIKRDYVISGRVVANDRMGELQHCFIVDDESGGIVVEVDCEDVDSYVPLYSAVEIRCSGLNVGRIGSRIVLGAAPTSEYVVDRIRESELFNYISVDISATEPPEPLKCIIADIDVYDVSRYVSVDSVQFVAEEWGMSLYERDSTGYIPTLRHITDGRDTLRVITSPATLYREMTIPDYAVRCRGVIEWWSDDVALRIINRHIQPI